MEGFLAESLNTLGLVLCKIGRHREAQRALHRAYQIAERCGDIENSCIALLTVMEEMGAHLDEDESLELMAQLDRFLVSSQKASTIERIKKCQELIPPSHAPLVSTAKAWDPFMNADG